jgi:hypothetical protein
MPANDELWEIVVEAARDAAAIVRHGLGYAGWDELRIWWAAHAGAEFLSEPVTVTGALSASLQQRSEQEAPCPAALPSGARTKALTKLVNSLGRVSH